MTVSFTISPTEFDLLRELIEQECGIAIGDDKAYLIETRLSKLLVENRCDSFMAFYQKAKIDVGLRDKIVDAMTTNETLWFRDTTPYTTFEEVLFPQFIQEMRMAQRRNVRIWSAACSTGQEPYSLALLAHEIARKGGGSELSNGGLSLTATDISPSALFLAKAARYDALSISRGMPDDLRERYFDFNGRVYVLKDSIKKMVAFEQLNLLKPFDHLGKFDVVMLRNVAIYFSSDFKTGLFKRVADILNPGGFLFLGSAESVLGYSQDFTTLQHHNCHYYQVKS